MVTEAQSSRTSRVVRIILAVIGLGMVVYAASDHSLYGGLPGFGKVQMVIAAVGVLLAAGSLLPIRFVQQLLLLTVTGLVMLVIAEVAGNAILGPMFRPIYQEDSKVVFKFVPDRTSTVTLAPINGGVTVTHRINSDGFRGPDLAPPGAGKRVVVYGDSFIHAFYTADQETFTSQLAVRLESDLGEAVEVVNAGTSSYGPDQVSVRLADELPVLKPDLVIVAVYAGNDYGDLMRNKMFRLADDGTLIENSWRLEPAISQMFQLSQRESILIRTLRNVVGAATRDDAVPRESDQAHPDGKPKWDFLLAEAEREYASLVINRNDVITNTHVDYYSADLSLRPNSDSARYKVRLMQAVLARIAATAQANDTPLLFMFIPHPADLTPDYDWGAVDLNAYPDYAGRNQIAPLEAFAADTAAASVSLFGPFRNSDPNELYFHGGDDHWNSGGQKLAAELVAAEIARHPWLAGKSETSN